MSVKSKFNLPSEYRCPTACSLHQRSYPPLLDRRHPPLLPFPPISCPFCPPRSTSSSKSSTMPSPPSAMPRRSKKPSTKKTRAIRLPSIPCSRASTRCGRIDPVSWSMAKRVWDRHGSVPPSCIISKASTSRPSTWVRSWATLPGYVPVRHFKLAKADSGVLDGRSGPCPAVCRSKATSAIRHLYPLPLAMGLRHFRYCTKYHPGFT